MAIISTESRKKIYHLTGECVFARRISVAHLEHVGRRELERRGYRACSCCGNPERLIREDMNQVRNRLERLNLKYRQVGGFLLIQSEIGFWKLERGAGGYTMYHGNFRPLDSAAVDQHIPSDYHLQRDVPADRTIQECIRYIRNHDDFRTKVPDYKHMYPSPTAPHGKKQKKKAKRQEQRQRRREDMITVRNLFAALEAENPGLKDYAVC